jgi:ribonuclease Z
MFDLTFLGTSASVPSADRNHPGLLVEAGGHRIMVDCGEGTQRQLLRSGAGFRRLDRLFLTHGHFDHVLGIPGLFSTLRLRQASAYFRFPLHHFRTASVCLWQSSRPLALCLRHIYM